MPRKVDKYLCDFKCGRNAEDLYNMTEHEKRCWKNPQVKSCMTCKHEETKGCYTTYLEEDFRSCAISETSGALFTIEEVNKERKLAAGKRTIWMPKVNCKHWEAK